MGPRLVDLVGTTDNKLVDPLVDRIRLLSVATLEPWNDISDRTFGGDRDEISDHAFDGSVPWDFISDDDGCDDCLDYDGCDDDDDCGVLDDYAAWAECSDCGQVRIDCDCPA